MIPQGDSEGAETKTPPLVEAQKTLTCRVSDRVQVNGQTGERNIYPATKIVPFLEQKYLIAETRIWST